MILRLYLKINSNIQIFYSNYEPINAEELKNKKFIAISGIGNPENFLNLLKKIGIIIVKNYILPDHYQFNKEEVNNIVKEAEDNNCEVILTEKDYFKVKDFNLKRVECLKVELNIPEREKLLKTILEIYD